MSYSYSLSSTSHGRGDDVTPFPPELDDAMLEDRLEQARLNRTNYYRRMLASRTRPLDDHVVTRKSVGGYTSGGSGTSISDTSGTVPVPKIPQPHCSWRFYTSYDNGEWKRHAVPVDHDVEDILREPTKTPRRERDKVSPPSPASLLETGSSIRRSRQAGGSLAACLQPRTKRTSESYSDGVVAAAAADSRVVGLQGPGGGQAINGLDAQLAGQLGPAELMGLCGGNEELVRQILEGGGLVAGFEGENHPPGKVKQEFSSKYMSTVTVTQPALGANKSPAVQGEGGSAESDGAGVQKSRRPRIYGFQEKIIIPTKYKTSAENQEKDGVAGVQTDSTGHHPGSKVNQDAGKVNGVAASSGTDDVKTETRAMDRSSTMRSSSGRTRTSPESQKVKVVVVNSGSDVESDRRSEERKEGAEEEQEKKKKEEGGELAEVVQKEPGTMETFAPFVIQEGLTPMENFQAFQENIRRQFESASVEKKDGAAEQGEEEEEKKKKGGSSTSNHPGQRLFSKDEQTFSDVGPDGQKRDGKVVSTYEVVTTTAAAAATDGDPSPPRGDEGPASIREISITPVGPVRSQLTAIQSPPAERRRTNDGVVYGARGASPFGGGGDHRSVKIIRDTGSNPALGQKTVEIVREHGATGGRSPLAVRRTVAEESSFSSPPKSEERRGVRTSGGGDVSIFDQTGSLFKQISPRPRAEREREFASPRDARQWSHDQGGGGGGYTGGAVAATTTTATRTWTEDGSTAGQPQSARRKVVIVREMDTAAGGGGATDGGDGEGQRSAVSSSSSSSRKKTVEIVREGDGGEPAGHHPPSIVFREPDGKADQSCTRTTVKIVRETGDVSGTTVKTPRETDSEISSLEGATSFGGRVLFASSKGKANPERVHLSSSPSSSSSSSAGSAAKQSSRIGGDTNTSSAEQWEVQVAVKD